MKNSLNLFLFALSMMTTVFLFGQSKNAIEHSLVLQQVDFLSSFDSKPIKVETEIPTPFIMLSGYVETENFKGNLFYKTELDNEWTDWKSFQLQTEGITPNRTVFFGGMIDEQTTQIKIKSHHKLSSEFKLRLFAPGHSSGNNIDISADEENVDCPLPPVSYRADWCPSGDCPIDTTPEPTVPTHFIIHHSGVENTSSDFAAVVRGIYNYHTGTNGWDDIGYNWLIDPNGVIYEGRAQGLQGAHFSCINENTVGICVLGNFEIETPTTEAISELKNLLAWGAFEESIDVLGNDFHPSSNSNLGNISGHLDGNGLDNSCTSTACPGVNFYGLLPSIKNEIAEYPCLQGNPSNVNTLLENEKIEIFPNPNNGNFQVNFENVEITNIVIYNSIGQEIENDNKTFTNSFFQNKIMKIATNGLYHLQFHLNDGRVISEKVVVTK